MGRRKKVVRFVLGAVLSKEYLRNIVVSSLVTATFLVFLIKIGKI